MGGNGVPLRAGVAASKLGALRQGRGVPEETRGSHISPPRAFFQTWGLTRLAFLYTLTCNRESPSEWRPVSWFSLPRPSEVCEITIHFAVLATVILVPFSHAPGSGFVCEDPPPRPILQSRRGCGREGGGRGVPLLGLIPRPSAWRLK